MSELSTRNKKFRRFFIVGTAFFVVALLIWLVPTIYIGNVEGKISLLELGGELTEPEQTMLIQLQWSRMWWVMTQATFFNPTATILLSISLIILVYGLIVRFAWNLNVTLKD